jgi:hypothetical protein
MESMSGQPEVRGISDWAAKDGSRCGRWMVALDLDLLGALAGLNEIVGRLQPEPMVSTRPASLF